MQPEPQAASQGLRPTIALPEWGSPTGPAEWLYCPCSQAGPQRPDV